MTADEFNEDWKDYLEKGHYGLDINIPSVVKYLNEEFQVLSEIPGFSYSQIKLKFNMARFYCEPDSIDSLGIEREIDKLVKEHDDRLSEERKSCQI